MKEIHFTKMHGTGNNYIYVDCTKAAIDNPQRVAKLVSDVRFGIGSDGLILICPPENLGSEFTMKMYNADGSEGNMCGNGIRCVGKYVYDKGLTQSTHFSVDTKSGTKHLVLGINNGVTKSVKVDMGAPIWKACDIPISLKGLEKVINQPVTFTAAGGHTLSVGVTAVSMGNPHCVINADFDIYKENQIFETFGPVIENHEIFPERVNTEFVNLIDDHTLKMRVWERGSAETYSCGTGACAVATVAATTDVFYKNINTTGTTSLKILVRGGELIVHYDHDNNTVFLEGPAEFVCEGIFFLPE